MLTRTDCVLVGRWLLLLYEGLDGVVLYRSGALDVYVVEEVYGVLDV